MIWPEGHLLQQPLLVERDRLSPQILCCSKFTQVAYFIFQAPEKFCRGGVRVVAKVISRWTGAGERIARITLITSTVAIFSECFVLLAIHNRWNRVDQAMLATGLLMPLLASSMPIGIACDRKVNYSDYMAIQLPKVFLRVNILSFIIHSILWVANVPMIRTSDLDSSPSNISLIVPLISSVFEVFANAAAMEFVMSRPPAGRPIPAL